MDKPEDIFFFHSLFDYHQRREEALAYVQPSQLLISLRSGILTFSNLQIIGEVQKIEEGDKLLNVFLTNEKKIERLSRKINQSKSIRRQRTWYQIILRLYQEMLYAGLRMKELEDG